MLNFSRLKKIIPKKNSRPVLCVSFPRSGSNFLQSVVSSSLNVESSSIYGNSRPSVSFLKSHALSVDWLEDEVSRLTDRDLNDFRIIWLWRDPRDVFCSYYDFVCNRKSINVKPEEFLDEISFEYSMEYGTAKTWERRCCIAPCSIWNAYKMHIINWNNQANTGSVVSVRYEHLLDPQSDSWDVIFNVFDAEGITPSAKAFDRKVAQYGSGKRKRGGVATWKNATESHLRIADLLQKRVKEDACLKPLFNMENL